MLNLILFVSDEGLKQDDLLLVGWILNVLSYLYCLVIITIFEVTLGKIEFVLGYFRIVFGKLLIDSGGIEEILAHIVAVGKE